MPVTNYLWDEQNCLAESDENNDIQTVYTHEPETYGKLISERQGSTSLYHHYDALGTTRQLTNNAGSVSDTWIYDAWGNQIARTGTTVIAFTWIGEVGYYYDSEMGLFRVGNRTYGPTIARWTSVDPFWTIVRQGNYRYSFNSPVNYVDPSGLGVIARVTIGVAGPFKIGSADQPNGEVWLDASQLARLPPEAGVVSLDPVVLSRAWVGAWFKLEDPGKGNKCADGTGSRYWASLRYYEALTTNKGGIVLGGAALKTWTADLFPTFRTDSESFKDFPGVALPIGLPEDLKFGLARSYSVGVLCLCDADKSLVVDGPLTSLEYSVAIQAEGRQFLVVVYDTPYAPRPNDWAPFFKLKKVDRCPC